MMAGSGARRKYPGCSPQAAIFCRWPAENHRRPTASLGLSPFWAPGVKCPDERRLWSSDGPPDLCATQDDGIGDLRVALERLPSEYRRPLLMQVQLGYSTAEIARELRLSRPAVLTRLYRARMRLKKELSTT
jgi:DNA-directed RNA polymerase specialized sigma24 family protein